jgi:GTP cyclohydrolase I
VPSKAIYDIGGELEDVIKGLLKFLVLDSTSDEFKETPRRAAEWFLSFAREPDYEAEFDQFLAVDFESPHQELVMVHNLEFVSLCPHHLLPYSGTAAIGYIPGKTQFDKAEPITGYVGYHITPAPNVYRVVGISKLARALWYWTHWPVKQEDSTALIADALMKHVGAAGAMVVLQAKHTCMAHRGVNQTQSLTTTSAARGFFQQDGSGLRQEFLTLMR